MNKLVVGVLVVGGCLVAQAGPTTFYAAPDGADDADCTSWETAGSLSNAIAKVKAWANVWVSWDWNRVNKAESWDNPNRVILRRGTYDLSSFSGGSFADLNGANYCYLVIESEDNDPTGTLLVGGGTNANARCFRMADSVQQRLVGLCITNWGHDWVASPKAQGAGVFGRSTVMVSNCIVTCCQSGIGGGIAGDSLYATGPSVYDSTVSHCYAKEGGGIYASGRIVRSVVCHNSSPKGPAIGGNNSHCYIYDSLIATNSGSSALYSVYAYHASNTTFIANDGGIQYMGGSYDQTNINCKYIGNLRTSGSLISSLGGMNAHYIGCTFRDNVAHATGGIIACNGNFGQFSTFTNCVFDGNVVTNSGLEQYSCHSACISGAGSGATKVKCYDCVFRNNKVTRPTPKWESGYGAVVRSTVLYDCVFSNNWCYSVGAVGNSILTRCTLVGNGADYCAAASSCTFTNCLIAANYCPTLLTTLGNTSQFGALVGCKLVNCTVTANSNNVAGVLGVTCSKGTYENTILVGNVPYDLGGLIYEHMEGNSTYRNVVYGKRHSSVTDARINVDNLWQTNETNKVRFDAANPWHLKRRSFGIDIGRDVGWTADDVDLAGARRLNGIVDLGCYEWWPRPGGLMLLVR